MANIRDLIKTIAEDFTPSRPNLLWLGLEQKGVYDFDPSSPYYPHAGSFVVKGDIASAFPDISTPFNRIGIGKNITLLHLATYYRYEKDEGTFTRRTNPFKNFEEAYDMISGQPLMEITNGVSLPQRLKELGWTFNLLWFVVVVESQIKEPFGACFLLRRTSYASFRQWVKGLISSKQSLTDGFIKVTSKKVQNPKGGVYFVPVFELTPFDQVKLGEKKENFIIQALQEFRKQVDDYVASFKQPSKSLLSEQVEQEETDFPEFNF